MQKNKVFLHICCAGCGAYAAQVLVNEGYAVFLYFYNPNIFPAEEYEIRASEVARIAEKYGYEFFIEEYNHLGWLEKIKNLEAEPEKGGRCVVCYQDRLEKTAQAAIFRNFDIFASTLSVSPHKLVLEINRIGNELASEFGLEFLDRDFKKQEGFKKASLLSKELGLYRQSYCGCEFSQRKVA